MLKPVLPTQSLKDAGPKVPAPHFPLPRMAETSPEVEEMEIVTSQLSAKLNIEDIDAGDSDNPQLCVEYVKEIYEYLMTLEVSLI